jgi:hypothetical protein
MNACQVKSAVLPSGTQKNESGLFQCTGTQPDMRNGLVVEHCAGMYLETTDTATSIHDPVRNGMTGACSSKEYKWLHVACWLRNGCECDDLHT